ncbi:hypothetical protein HDU93_004750, partial [Gonapodya sp. JEL0774]
DIAVCVELAPSRGVGPGYWAMEGKMRKRSEPAVRVKEVREAVNLSLQNAIAVHANPLSPTDPTTWPLLPALFASTLYKFSQLPETGPGSGVYLPGVGWDGPGQLALGVVPGNAGCIVEAFLELTNAVGGLLGGDEKRQMVAGMEEEFWKLSTALLVRLHSAALAHAVADKDKPDRTAPHLRAAFAALQVFGRGARYFKQDRAEMYAGRAMLEVGSAGVNWMSSGTVGTKGGKPINPLSDALGIQGVPSYSGALISRYEDILFGEVVDADPNPDDED